MKEKLERLARLRRTRAKVEEHWKTINKRFKASPRYKGLYLSRKDLDEEMKDLEADIRAEAVDNFDGQNKKPIEGVGIQESESYEYTYEKAMDWARKFAPLAIVEQLDTSYLESTFDQLVKSGKLPNFVTIAKETKATIARDLSSYLEDTDNG